MEWWLELASDDESEARMTPPIFSVLLTGVGFPDRCERCDCVGCGVEELPRWLTWAERGATAWSRSTATCSRSRATATLPGNGDGRSRAAASSAASV